MCQWNYWNYEKKKESKHTCALNRPHPALNVKMGGGDKRRDDRDRVADSSSRHLKGGNLQRSAREAVYTPQTPRRQVKMCKYKSRNDTSLRLRRGTSRNQSLNMKLLRVPPAVNETSYLTMSKAAPSSPT